MNKINVNYAVPAFRRLEILKLIEDKGVVQIAELAQHCGVSQATVRRDLNDLDREGIIRRTHGGAVMAHSLAYEQPHHTRTEIMRDEKERIAKAAAGLISDGDSIFIDSGTTAVFLSQHLEGLKDLTVVTHNLGVIFAIKLHPTSQLVVTGGVRQEDFSILCGSTTESFLRDIKVEKSFVGADAIDSQNGLFSYGFEQANLKKLAVECGRIRVLISDSSKYSIGGLVKVCDIDRFDFIITDKGLEKDNELDIRKRTAGLVLV